MRLVNTKAHAIVDYILGLILLSAGWIFHFDGEKARFAADVAGIIVLLNTLVTRFELGFLQLIPLRVHIAIDVVLGITLAISPWLFRFSDQAYKPHFVFGITVMAIGVLSDRVLWSTVRKDHG